MNASPGMRDDDRVEETAEPRPGPGVGLAAREDRAAGPAAQADPSVPADPAAQADPSVPADPAAQADPSVPADPAAQADPSVPANRPAGEDPDVLILASEQGAPAPQPAAVPEPATDPDERWHEIQVMFVDDPLGSVERAADLASDLVSELISLL